MPARDIPAQERARAILETLAESGPSTTTELATALESHPVTVERRCRALQRAGYIRHCASGVYALADSDSDPNASPPADATVDGQPSTNPAD